MSDLLVRPERLKGFMDKLPFVATKGLEMINTIYDIAIKNGFLAIDTPSIEKNEILFLLDGDDTQKQAFKFIDQGGRSVGLRYDLTVPFARFIAEHEHLLSFPFRRVQVGKVWRGETPQAGRYREFTQCDLDIIDKQITRYHEFEVLVTIAQILETFNVGKFTILLGNRKLLNYLLESILNINGKEALIVLRIIDKLDKIGYEGVINELGSLGYDIEKINLLITCLSSQETNIIEEYLNRHSGHNNELNDELSNLTWLYNKLSSNYNNSNICFKINLSIARGLDYYTGIVFETFLEGANIGSVASGGRYDYLVNRFSKSIYNGIGASIGLDRLLSCINVDNNAKLVDVALFALGGNCFDKVVDYANTLRNANISANINVVESSLTKFIKKINAKYIAVVGNKELSSGMISLRHHSDSLFYETKIDELISSILQNKAQ